MGLGVEHRCGDRRVPLHGGAVLWPAAIDLGVTGVAAVVVSPPSRLRQATFEVSLIESSLCQEGCSRRFGARRVDRPGSVA